MISTFQIDAAAEIRAGIPADPAAAWDTAYISISSGDGVWMFQLRPTLGYDNRASAQTLRRIAAAATAGAQWHEERAEAASRPEPETPEAGRGAAA
jgi:hypothetical protein